MRKIPTLFVREFLPNHKIIITDQVALVANGCWPVKA